MYNITAIFPDGFERKKTLIAIAKEIETNNPRTIVEFVSKKKGQIWIGHAENITADLRKDFLTQCVQNIEETEDGVTVIIR